MKHTFACLPLLLPLMLHAEENWRIFMAEDMNAELIRQEVQKHLPNTPGQRCEYIILPKECKTLEKAHAQARAIECGVTALPAAVLTDEHGPFATLPLRHLTEDKLQEARANKETSGRREDAQKHRLEAHLFLLCARVAMQQEDDANLAIRIEECRNLVAHAHATDEHRQFIGLRLLYPLLMEQYKRGYYHATAHNPTTEAKLLEAIAALEAARDINAESALGKQAFAERERLRAARRKSRQYE